MFLAHKVLLKQECVTVRHGAMFLWSGIPGMLRQENYRNAEVRGHPVYHSKSPSRNKYFIK